MIGEYKYNPYTELFDQAALDRFQLDLNALHPYDHELAFDMSVHPNPTLSGLARQSQQKLANRLFTHRLSQEVRAGLETEVKFVYYLHFRNASYFSVLVVLVIMSSTV